jgi:tetratricopeptide (TPR) repeat protein
VHHWRDLHDFQLALHMAPESLESAVAGYRLDPTNSASLVRIGNVATKLGDLLSAAEIENVFERLLASSTRDTRYWIGLSGWLTKSGRMDAARLALERCLEIDPNHLAAQQLLSGLTHVGFAAASPTESDGTPVSPEPRRGLTRLFAGVRSILRR